MIKCLTTLISEPPRDMETASVLAIVQGVLTFCAGSTELIRVVGQAAIFHNLALQRNCCARCHVQHKISVQCVITCDVTSDGVRWSRHKRSELFLKFIKKKIDIARRNRLPWLSVDGKFTYILTHRGWKG